jgi:hypothetical protein
MTLPAASLGGAAVNVFWLGYLDFDGDPLRVTTLPYDYTPTGTGDADLDDEVFLSLPAQLVSISPVVNAEGGTDAVDASLAGIPVANQDLLDLLAVPGNWRGRTFRLWRGLADSAWAPSVLEAYHTGYMMQLAYRGGATQQTITVKTENWLAAFTTPRNRTYQDQSEHDATDNSAARIRAAANGIQTAGGFLPGTVPQMPWTQGGGFDFNGFFF